MLLDEASVTGTANIVMTAVMASGKTSDLQCSLRTLSTTTLQDAKLAWGQKLLVLALT
jgi:UDP-N-acetylglucosamine enolpyruvyl transferase